MSKIVSIHSFARGAGKTTLVADLAVLLAAAGKRVGVVDTDLAVPSLHSRFGVEPASPQFTLNDFLLGQCLIRQAAVELTDQIDGSLPGAVFFVPASADASDIVHVLRHGFDVTLLAAALQALIAEFQLDVLLVDTQVGLNEASLACFAISEALLVVLRLDKEDYLGTGVVVDVAQQLAVPTIQLIVNLAPPEYPEDQVKDTHRSHLPMHRSGRVALQRGAGQCRQRRPFRPPAARAPADRALCPYYQADIVTVQPGNAAWERCLGALPGSAPILAACGEHSRQGWRRSQISRLIQWP